MDQTTNSTEREMRTTRNDASRAPRVLTQWIIRWLLFFLICLGLGYSALQRYDPRATQGLTDSALYYRMVAGEEVQGREMRFRVLVPLIARPIHTATKTFLDPIRAVFLALLIANSIFCATTVCLLVAIGIRLTGNPAVALLAAALYLLNFAIGNLQLAAMVDAGEACLILAVVLTLFSDRWWPLPVWGLLGAMAKETFLPLAGVLTLVWWYVECRKQHNRISRLLLIVAMLVVAVITIVALRWGIAGTMGSSGMFVATNAAAGYSGIAGVFLNRTFLYVFVWLLPLGLVGLKRLPRAWVFGAIAATLLALVLGAYRNIGANAARPMFDVIGPMLSLSVAMLLTGAKVRTRDGLSGAEQA
jgi:hypothetical protein